MAAEDLVLTHIDPCALTLLGEVNSAGEIVADLRPSAIASAAGALLAEDNLSELENADAALDNLGGTTVGKDLFMAEDAAAVPSYTRRPSGRTSTGVAPSWMLARSMRWAVVMVVPQAVAGWMYSVMVPRPAAVLPPPIVTRMTDRRSLTTLAVFVLQAPIVPEVAPTFSVITPFVTATPPMASVAVKLPAAIVFEAQRAAPVMVPSHGAICETTTALALRMSGM